MFVHGTLFIQNSYSAPPCISACQHHVAMRHTCKQQYDEWNCVMSVCYPTTRNRNKSHWVYFALIIRCDSCSGLSEGVDIQGLQCGTVGLTQRVRYTEKVRLCSWKKPLGRNDTEKFSRRRWNSPSDEIKLKLNSRRCCILVEYAVDYSL